MRRVLLTGATGFIGRQCIEPLLARGFEVHGVSYSGGAGDRRAHWHEVDLLSQSQVVSVVERVRPTHLLHLAWYAVPGSYWTSWENFAWVRGSLGLMQAFADGADPGFGRRIVMAGSCAEYDWSQGRFDETTTPLKPHSVYGTCKHALQLMLGAYSRQFGVSSAWGRVFFVYGPHEPRPRLVPSVVLSLLRGEPAMCTTGEQRRDFLHVSDVADAFVSLLDSEVQGPVNIASGEAVSVRDMVLCIARKLNRVDLVRFGARPGAAGDPGLIVAEVTRLTEELGWRARYDLNIGLDGAIAWWREQLS